MSWLSRLFARSADDSYARGITLYEAGRYAEASELLRGAAGPEGSAPRSLAAFYLRQSLVAEGRRLLRAGRAADAAVPLAEAVGTWSRFPDLQFLLGAARGLSGDWQAALAAADLALRENPDYAEAHLLRAAALAGLDRSREAAAALDALVETGRRRQSSLASELARDGGWQAAGPPPDLADRLRALVTAGDPEREVVEAVALCRAGRWREGIAALRAMVGRHPRYPDLRVRLAAALFQVGDLPEAREQVEAALALNEHYRSAVHLRAIVQADQRDLAGALATLRGAPAATAVHHRQAHEDLLAAYLEAVLELLTGRPATAEALLAPQAGLTGGFARAQLLRAAAADLRERPEAAQAVLAELVEAWPADAEYRHLLVGLLLRRGALREAERELGRWPAGPEADERPLLLAARLALARGEVPQRPPEAQARPESPAATVPAPAWRLLAAEAAAAAGRWPAALASATALWRDGWRTEGTARILALCRARAPWPDPSTATDEGGGSPDAGPPDAEPPLVVPAAVLPATIWFLARAGRTERADELLRLHHGVHPEEPRWLWLQAGFWLEPIRRWIG